MSDPAPATPVPPAPADPNLNNPAPAPAAGDPPANPAPAADPAPAAPPAGDPPPAAGDWPDDWRDKYAKGDEKKLKRLQRYGSPAAALDALFNAQQKIAQGVREPLAADATPEEVAAWRQENGVPAEPSGYKMPDGLVLSENDKPLVDEFLKVAHDRNWKDEDVQAAVGWFMERHAAQADAMSARDAENRMKADEALRAEFGPQYKQEAKLAFQLLAQAPEGLGDAIMGGRLADGRLIGDSPEVIRWLNGLARELNPVATVVPGSGSNAMQALETELAGIQKMMSDRGSDYWKGPKSASLQKRALELINAQQKQGRKAA